MKLGIMIKADRNLRKEKLLSITFGEGDNKVVVKFPKNKKPLQRLGEYVYSDLKINHKEPSDGDLTAMLYSEITDVQIAGTNETYDYLRIEKITIREFLVDYELPEKNFGRYTMKRVETENQVLDITGQQYYELKDFFNNERLVENFENAVDASNIDKKQKILLLNKNTKLPLAKFFEDDLYDRIDGECEYYAIRECLTKIGKYKITSNKGTEYEDVQKAILTNKQFEEIKEAITQKKSYIFYDSIYGEIMDAQFVSSITKEEAE